MTQDEKIFLSMIKPSCTEYSIKARITPSVVAALAIINSSWGTIPEAAIGFNLHGLLVGDNWFGKCYSKYSNIKYNSVNECQEVGAILYRVYDSYDLGIEDFVDYLVTTRRSPNGPYKYASIVRCSDYKETIDRLVRAGFMKDYFNMVDDVSFIQNIIAIIEKYELYNWDDALKIALKEEENKLSKKKKVNINKQLNLVEGEATEGLEIDDTEEYEDEEEVEEEAQEQEEPTMENFEHMYRVRLAWERPDTQIFASPIYADAKEEALKHEGYKIYIDDEGELFEDPWIKVEPEPVDDSPVKSVTIPVAGSLVILKKNTPVYKTAIATQPFIFMEGEFYYYDYTVTNGRAKITKFKDAYKKADPSLIFGYIEI